jgi:hypothetical protein
MKSYEYVAVTEREDDSLRVNYVNDIDQFTWRYGDYHWAQLVAPKDKLNALNEACKSSVFDSHEQTFLAYELENFDLKESEKKKFFRIRKTKEEKVAEVIAAIPRIRNSVFDVRD